LLLPFSNPALQSFKTLRSCRPCLVGAREPL
jgi:hypothetical protein